VISTMLIILLGAATISLVPGMFSVWVQAMMAAHTGEPFTDKEATEAFWFGWFGGITVIAGVLLFVLLIKWLQSNGL